VLSLITLAEEAKHCQKCGLHEKRRNVVFGEGNPSAPLVLVGEGPGEQEDQSGRPFVGRSGQLLDRVLAECGLDRSQVYICNTVKCRAADWSTGKPMNRPPTPEESLACRHWLYPQLDLVAPEVILCIGAPSAKNLIKKNFKITQERGMVFRSDLSQALMATLHPAYIIRQSTKTYDGGFSLLVEDIAKAWRGASRLREGRGAGGFHDRKVERDLKKELEISSDRLKLFDSQ
jgi:DNA polymerase